jgi:peptidyl-prolyl cis-trans isomerase SurA
MNRCASVLAALLAASAPAALAQSSDGILLNRIAAVVNEGVVLQSELDSQVLMIARQLREQGTSLPPREVLEQQVMETLIVQQIQLQRAFQRGISISDERLNAALRQVAERNGLTLTQLPAAMASEGIDYARYREEMRKEMIIDSLRQIEVFSGIAVSEREIARYLDREAATASDQVDYDISHILVAVDQDAPEDALVAAETRINEIHDRLLNGEDFAETAVAYSDGQRALEGGQLGWRKGTQLPPFLADTVVNLEPGEISYPIRSQSGFHIVKVNDVRGSEKSVELQTRARHILIRPNEVMDDESVRQKLLQIRERIDEGDSFADIARVESEDPVSAAEGGDLGWSSTGTFHPVFEDQLARLSEGEISQPFRTPFGWHLVELIERTERDTTEEKRRQRAVQAIRTGKVEQETEIWLRRLRDEAYVEIRS